MSLMNDFYSESRFGGFTEIDGTIPFYIRVNALLDPSSVVLDIGCGRGAYGEDHIPIRRDLRIFKGKVKKVIGVDVDKTAATNPYIDEFHLIVGGGGIPLNDASVDCCVCDYVLEHIEKPDHFFMEISRVLKKGGYLCIRTPNLWGYVSILSKLIPNQYHASVTERVQNRRKEEDVFPTYYRCNSIYRIGSILDKYGFLHAVYGYETEPAYLSFSKFAYRLGVWYQRFAPGFLRTTIFAFARKT